jgi:hypothetical protein
MPPTLMSKLKFTTRELHHATTTCICGKNVKMLVCWKARCHFTA